MQNSIKHTNFGRLFSNNISCNSLVVFFVFIFGMVASLPAFSDTNKAPLFTLPGQNKTIDLSQYKGKVVYLDFWASWCDPCKRSFPWMNKLQEQYGSNGFEVVAISLDESRKDAEKFLSRVPANFEVAFDETGKTAKSYKLKAMPSSYIIDRDGRLVHKSLGFRNEEKKVVEARIQQLTSDHLVANR